MNDDDSEIDLLMELLMSVGIACTEVSYDENGNPQIKDVTPEFIGVDWAENSGMNRGDVISRSDNVVNVRFKTVTFEGS